MLSVHKQLLGELLESYLPLKILAKFNRKKVLPSFLFRERCYRPTTLSKRDSAAGFFCINFRALFIEHLQTTVPAMKNMRFGQSMFNKKSEIRNCCCYIWMQRLSMDHVLFLIITNYGMIIIYIFILMHLKYDSAN